MEEVRLDVWLCATRLYKSRTLAQKSCESGQVKVNDIVAKSSRGVRIGDKIEARAPRGLTIVVVRGIHDKRLSVPLARELYEDQSPVPPERDEIAAYRPRGAGRPTKAERRDLVRLRGDLDFD